MLSDFLLNKVFKTPTAGRNPCFSGLCSLTTLLRYYFGSFIRSRNPCFSGLCSLTLLSFNGGIEIATVVILVLVDYAL